MPDVTPATLGVDDTILASDLEVPGAPEKAAPRSPDITRPLTPVPPLQVILISQNAAFFLYITLADGR